MRAGTRSPAYSCAESAHSGRVARKRRGASGTTGCERPQAALPLHTTSTGLSTTAHQRLTRRCGTRRSRPHSQRPRPNAPGRITSVVLGPHYVRTSTLRLMDSTPANTMRTRGSAAARCTKILSPILPLLRRAELGVDGPRQARRFPTADRTAAP
jgi:hypothetical protein